MADQRRDGAVLFHVRLAVEAMLAPIGISGLAAAFPGVPLFQRGTAEVARLTELLRGEPWLEGALSAVAASGLPDAWIGAGAVRDVVWGQLYGEFSPDSVRDVDVAYFDPADLSAERDVKAQETLAVLADVPWEATNQAAVHTWYHHYFGGAPVEPFSCVHDAIATWPA